MKRNEGITLIALVITIIIIIILASITINFAFGDRGLINMAELAKDEAANSTQYESDARANLVAYMNEYIAGLNGGNTGGETENPSEQILTVEVNTTNLTNNKVTLNVKAEGKELANTETYTYYLEEKVVRTTTDSSYEYINLKAGRQYKLKVAVKDINGNITEKDTTITTNNNVLKADGSIKKKKGVNTPNLGQNMEFISFEEETNEWETDNTNSNYSYTDTSEEGREEQSNWANAIVTKDGVDSYFVWIPRYAYKITYYTDESETQVSTSDTPTAYGKIDIKFIKGTGNIATDGTVCKYASEKPDVTQNYVVHPAFTTDANQGGGWSTELAGIWIGKFEASQVEGKSDTLKIQPGATAWEIVYGDFELGDAYTISYNYARELDSHMLKNSEWGATAYLTESKYGRNGTEVMYGKETDLTGGGEGISYATTNTNQSSTGNAYGIYDLSKNPEYVSAHDADGVTSNVTDSTNFPFRTTSNQYITVYNGTTASSYYKYGDATYETLGWHSDYVREYYFEDVCFERGHGWGDYSKNGIFAFSASWTSGGVFRTALVVV